MNLHYETTVVMHTHTILFAMAAMILAIWRIIKLYKWSNRYRKLWIEMGVRRDQLERIATTAIAERDEWVDTAQANLLARGHHKATIAALKKEVTDQASHVDSLMNGDRRCMEGHRYYTGQGVTCPHCNSEEACNMKPWSLRAERSAIMDIEHSINAG